MAQMNTVTTSSATSAALPEKTSGLISVRLDAVVPVAKDTNLYTFKRVEGGALPAYKPGAHIDLHLPNGLVRQFSLVVPNTDPEIYVVGVKRDAEGRGGSRYIVDEMRVGQEIKISAPRNHFPLVESGEPVVLIAGGIGITPIWCMTQELDRTRTGRTRPGRTRPDRARSAVAALLFVPRAGGDGVPGNAEDARSGARAFASR